MPDDLEDEEFQEFAELEPPVEDLHEGEEDDDVEGHTVPPDLLELHVALEAQEAGLL